MRSPRLDEPRLFAVKAADLPLSGSALLELMRAVLARGVPFRFCARGWSMAPFVHDGDVITVSPPGSKPPGVGEVVAYLRPQTGTLVVHRVISRRGDGLRIRGDGAPGWTFEMIPPENVLGRVARIERNGHDVRLGLGAERYVIAWLSRTGLLMPLRMWFVSRVKPLLRWRG